MYILDLRDFYNHIVSGNIPTSAEILLSEKIQIIDGDYELDPMDTIEFIKEFEENKNEIRGVFNDYGIFYLQIKAAIQLEVISLTEELLDPVIYISIHDHMLVFDENNPDIIVQQLDDEIKVKEYEVDVDPKGLVQKYVSKSIHRDYVQIGSCFYVWNTYPH